MDSIWFSTTFFEKAEAWSVTSPKRLFVLLILKINTCLFVSLSIQALEISIFQNWPFITLMIIFHFHVFINAKAFLSFPLIFVLIHFFDWIGFCQISVVFKLFFRLLRKHSNVFPVNSCTGYFVDAVWWFAVVSLVKFSISWSWSFMLVSWHLWFSDLTKYLIIAVIRILLWWTHLSNSSFFQYFYIFISYCQTLFQLTFRRLMLLWILIVHLIFQIFGWNAVRINK